MRLLLWWWFRGTKGRIRNTDSLFLLCQFIRTDWPRDWRKASYLSPWTTRKLSSWRWATPCIKLIAAEAWLSEGVHWTHSLGSRCKCSANLLGWSPWIKYCTSLLSTVVHFFLLIFAIRWPSASCGGGDRKTHRCCWSGGGLNRQFRTLHLVLIKNGTLPARLWRVSRS